MSLKEISTILKTKKETISKEIVEAVLDRNLARFQEKVKVSLEDNIFNIVAQLQEELKKCIYRNAPKWTVYQKTTQLIPKNCKFMHTCGNNLVVVIEEDPKPRSVFLDKSLVEKWNYGTYYLSFPYVYFILHCKNSKADNTGHWILKNTYVFWRNQKLSSTEDIIYKTVMPNTREDESICMGKVSNGYLDLIVNESIQGYWSSTFNSDLSKRWNSKGKVCSLISTVISWEDNTKNDPSFILKGNWEAKCSLIDFVNKLAFEKSGDYSFEKDLDKTFHDFSSNVNNKLKETINIGFDKYLPKDVLLDLSELVEIYFSKLGVILENIENKVDTFPKMDYNPKWATKNWRRKNGIL